MKYPKAMIIGPQTVGVEILDNPLYQFYVCPKCTVPDTRGNIKPYRYPAPYGTHPPCPACKIEETQPVDNTYVLGQYMVKDNKIRNWHSDDPNLIDVCKTSFVHEVIEAIDSIRDLKLNHTQITTLAGDIYQAFNTGQMWAEAA